MASKTQLQIICAPEHENLAKLIEGIVFSLPPEMREKVFANVQFLVFRAHLYDGQLVNTQGLSFLIIITPGMKNFEPGDCIIHELSHFLLGHAKITHRTEDIRNIPEGQEKRMAMEEAEADAYQKQISAWCKSGSYLKAYLKELDKREVNPHDQGAVDHRASSKQV